MTAHAFSEERVNIEQAGCDAVVTKPIIPKDLEKVLCALVDHPGMNAQAPAAPPKTQIHVTDGTLFKDIVEKASKAILDQVIIDAPELFERSGESIRRCKLIFNAFDSGIEALLPELRKVYETEDVVELNRIAHSIKGVLLEAGAMDASEFAKEIENLAKDGDLAGAKAKVPYLMKVTSEVRQVVREVTREIEETRLK